MPQPVDDQIEFLVDVWIADMPKLADYEFSIRFSVKVKSIF